MNKNISETELFLPIKNFFEKNGYIVQGEVKNCDIVCIKDNSITIIELKKSFNLKLVYQAIERKNITDSVFVAISRPKNFKKKEVKNMINLLKLLEIGLITVSLDSKLKNVDIVLNPNNKNLFKNCKKTNQILKEFNSRNINYNIGGSNFKNNKILTSYREKSIFIACILKILEKSSPKEIKTLTNIEDCGKILLNNYFSYFKKIDRGVYTLSKEGEKLFNQNDFKEVIKYYKKEAKKICLK